PSLRPVRSVCGGSDVLNITPFSPIAQQFLDARGLNDPELLARCHIEELSPAAMRERTGRCWQGLRIPYHLPGGALSGFSRYRFLPFGTHDVCATDPADAELPKIAGKNRAGEETLTELRYWQPKKSGVHLYMPPLADWLKAIADWRIPLILAE